MSTTVKGCPGPHREVLPSAPADAMSRKPVPAVPFDHAHRNRPKLPDLHGLPARRRRHQKIIGSMTASLRATCRSLTASSGAVAGSVNRSRTWTSTPCWAASALPGTQYEGQVTVTEDPRGIVALARAGRASLRVPSRGTTGIRRRR